jgi:hypothetical protein
MFTVLLTEPELLLTYPIRSGWPVVCFSSLDVLRESISCHYGGLPGEDYTILEVVDNPTSVYVLIDKNCVVSVSNKKEG